nr:hypothetical protein [Tanacetum cinerariifolium]
MGDDNPIRSLGDCSKPSHEGYMNTIKLPVGNNMVPLRSDTIQLVQTDAHYTGFGSRIQTNTSSISLNLWTHSTLMVKIRKEHACVYFNSPFAIKLVIGLNVFQLDPSPHGRILLLIPCSIFSTRKDHRNSQRYPDVPTTSWRIFIRSMNSLQGLTPESPSAWHRSTPMNLGKSLRTSPENGQDYFYGELDYLKHKINEKLIEGLVDSNIFNNSMSGTRDGKKMGKTYKVLPRGPVYDAILKNKITKKEDIGENFKTPGNVGGQKGINALVDQGSDVNVMPYITCIKLTNERPTETDIRLSLASHSYIYPLGIVEDILVEVTKLVYPVNFVILDIKENEKRPFILGTSFLITVKAIIKFDEGTITLRSGKIKASPGMGRKDKASPGKGDKVQPMEEQMF